MGARIRNGGGWDEERVRSAMRNRVDVDISAFCALWPTSSCDASSQEDECAEEDEESGTGEESDGGSKSSRGTKRRSTSRKLKGKAKAEENDQETFDLNDISSCSESEEGVRIEPPTQVKRRRGRPPKSTLSQAEPGPSKLKKPSVRARKGHQFCCYSFCGSDINGT